MKATVVTRRPLPVPPKATTVTLTLEIPVEKAEQLCDLFGNTSPGRAAAYAQEFAVYSHLRGPSPATEAFGQLTADVYNALAAARDANGGKF